MGARHGSVMGPLLFSLFINEFAECTDVALQRCADKMTYK